MCDHRYKIVVVCLLKVSIPRKKRRCAEPAKMIVTPNSLKITMFSNVVPMELTTPLLLENGGGSGATHDNDNDDASAILLSEEYLHDYAERQEVMRADSSCCWRIVKSIIVILLSLAGILASMYVILHLAKQPSNSFDIEKVMALIMASVAIGVSTFVIYTEIRILCGHSMDMKRRKSIRTLSQQMTSLRRKNKSLTNNNEDLEVHVTQYDATVMKLRSIIAADDDIEDIVNLVKDNEDILHQIRQYIRQQILYDIIKQNIKFPPDNYHAVLDYYSANELTTVYQAMITSKYGVYIDTQNFVHALASNSTYGGVLCTLSRMLGVVSSDNDDRGEDYDEGDEDTAFLLPNDDGRQVGSIHIAYAKLIGLMYTPLNPRKQRRRRTSVRREKDEGGDNDSDNEYNNGTPPSPPPKNIQGTIQGQLSKIWAIAFPYYRENFEGRVLFGILFLVLLINSAISVYYSYLFRDFFTYLSKKDVTMFYKTFNRFIVSLVLLLPIQISFGYIRVKLEIAWRKWLTERILQLYLSNKVYYGLERKAKSVAGSTREYKNRQSEMDNPDQRIQQDISSFTSYCVWTFIVIMNTSIDLVSFSIILYHILPQLFIAIIVFASMGTLITILVGKVLVKLNYESLQREADFRFILVRIRENAESIAFYGGEALEDRQAKQRLDRVIDNKNALK